MLRTSGMAMARAAHSAARSFAHSCMDSQPSFRISTMSRSSTSSARIMSPPALFTTPINDDIRLRIAG
jgi:hypothetical protein